MKRIPHLTAAMGILLTTLSVFSISCSNEPTSFKLRAKYDTPGKVIEYKLNSHRVGSAYQNEEMIEDFDIKVEGDMIYTTQKVLPNGNAMILEENVWSWDEPVDDSGQVKRITREYAYKYQMTPSGKIIDLNMLGEHAQNWEDYVRSHTDQGMPFFPDEGVTAGYSWTQTSSVTLPDSEIVEVQTTYTVKGTANKQGYYCAIIDYKGKLALPLFPDPEKTGSTHGVDLIEMNGILYFAIEEGIPINSEERRRVISKRTYENKEGETVNRRTEFEAFISYNLVGLNET